MSRRKIVEKKLLSEIEKNRIKVEGEEASSLVREMRDERLSKF